MITRASLLRPAGCYAPDCCHATFDNVAMAIIAAAERGTKSIRHQRAELCSLQAVVLDVHEASHGPLLFVPDVRRCAGRGIASRSVTWLKFQF